MPEAAAAPRYQSVHVGPVRIFYREAGRSDAPALLLLHGFPSSSRMFEPLLHELGGEFHLIAPDYPGFGLSDAPDPQRYTYTFDTLAAAIEEFVATLRLGRYTLYLQDYGGPVGLRLALAHPEQLRALIIQNAVLHEEGLTEAWNLRRAYWADRARHEPQVRAALASVEAGIARHVGGRALAQHFNPDLWMDEIAFLARPGMADIQLQLIYDYQSNLRAYPAWQAFLRQRRPPLLVLWGVHDPIFSVAGAQALRREQPDAELHLLEAGHFAINDCPQHIAQHLRRFLAHTPP
jgi:pimeloyl-ACP methyl ester carboxylesterase